MQISRAMWHRSVPKDLLGKFKQWLEVTGGVGTSKGKGLPEMLDSIVEGGSLVRRDAAKPDDVTLSRKARVISKNQEKCSFILNCMKLNESHLRPPEKFSSATD